MKNFTLFALVAVALAHFGAGCAEDEPGGSDGQSTGMDGGSSGQPPASSPPSAGGSGDGDSGDGDGDGDGDAAAGGEPATPATPPLTPTPQPEMPRDLEPDGVYCESLFQPPAEVCPSGSRCCPNGLGGQREEVCMPEGELCEPCGAAQCGHLDCDGPEDCGPGQFCCSSFGGFCNDEPGECSRDDSNVGQVSWITVECRDRCGSDLGDPDRGTVVCQDDRDCPGSFVAGRCEPFQIPDLPRGLKICSGP